ncbi:hypothetical protein [Paenibacillus abyssi]|uniref:Uncharacterized protein n=1 Tax=Paenibacillus abyssi TaxID=1340531 RepID=A0A917CHD7_9BACL|nr:hypothetical protein [Paenibacillus abyssi]GGF88554.1 hypothetical protein GCM10010916_02380 [Paenibacillus abyssi]
MAYIAKTDWTAANGIGAVDVNKWEQGIADAHTTADAALPAASYTAADVLAKLLTVDGAGSGLDAEMVSKYGLGTIAAAVPGNDWNQAIVTGFYMAQNATNQPTVAGAHSWKYGIVVQHNDKYALQKLTDFDNVASWVRIGREVGGVLTWGTWKRVFDENVIRINAGVLEFNDGGTWKVAGGVKNVQRGLASIASGATEVNVTIAAVNLSKAYVNPLTVPTGYTIDAQLTSTTNLYIRVRGITGGFVDISWEVVEFY